MDLCEPRNPQDVAPIHAGWGAYYTRKIRPCTQVRTNVAQPCGTLWTVDAGDVETAGRSGTRRAGYPRATGSARGEARRRDLLERVTDDLAANGLVDFSLRRAARAAGTTHKVLLYHFDGVEDLLGQVMYRLRERRIDNVLTAATRGSRRQSLASRVRALWPALADDASGLRVIDQAIGLAMYDPER